ncbi:VIT domain-containing protein [Tahibacter soli]|uniref:VIT domain-containing protein n=1 Tax=Tahibacter soli TaxID=2983605 RepID=A0A9X3YIC0_9GAMM|nr:VIT domain-containing protein [Tahibacter soli]MDC8011645.1 VIT domain-containing protein [Tahibacter soli]
MTTIGKVFVATLLAFAGSVAAQQQIAPPDTPPRGAQVWLDPSLGQLQPIQLHDVAISVQMQGFIASTRIDLTFFNPNSRVLEGELVFPLAEGQSITGYALEVNGKLRQGVVVEKETARVAYESTVRRGIDPGLAELTQGNVFRTRLYPLPPNGTKRVQLSFDQPMQDLGAQYRYVLPLALDQPARRFKVHAEAMLAEVAPTASDAGGALTFERWRDSFVADLERTDFKPGRELAFNVPKPKTPVAVFSVPDALEPSWQHFAAQVQSAPPAATKTPVAPRRVALFYDASGSAAGRDRARELDFLAAWFAQIKDTTVDLVAFRNDADPVQTFAIRGGDIAALRRAIDALPLDGGSSYGAIRPANAPDLVIVVGDGLSNFGPSEPALDGVPRLVFVHAAQRFDAARLTRWAQRYGGQAVNLLATDRDAALRQVGAARWLLQSTKVVAGECRDLAPRAPRPAAATFSLYGACSAGAKLELTFGDGAGATLARTIALGDGATVTHGKVLEPERTAFVERLWAVARIADLDNEEARDAGAIVELAKKYGVVTADTSMLVLDRIEDYVRYKVEPREPELADEYRRLLAVQPKDVSEDAARAAHRSIVLTQWTEFKEWHARRHPWLETVLKPVADDEAARWNALGASKDARGHADEARALAKQAVALQQRWPKEGAAPESRAAWEREAAETMLKLDALRQTRLALAPGSDAIKGESEEGRGGAQALGGAAPGTMRAREQTRAANAPVVVAEAAPAASPAPAPPPREMAFAEPELAKAVADDADKNVAPKPAEDRRSAPVAIELADWDPATPYLAKLRAAKDPYAAYLAERDRLVKSPSFFLDCANYFRNEAKDARLALRVLSNLAEIDFDSAPLLRVLAYRLQQWERFDLAVPLFEQALKLRGEEPQSRRDLALALSRRPDADYARAVALLWEVIDRRWDGRFPDIETIALHELNDVIARAPRSQRAALDALTNKLGIDARLLEAVPVDLRVVLSWDADNTDIDLWVIDPTGEATSYQSPRSRTGGRISRDFTGGYGPEVFTIRRALPGTYVVKTHYFSNRQQTLTGPATLQLEFLTRFDTGDSKRKAVTRRLENVNGDIEIGRFTVGAE